MLFLSKRFFGSVDSVLTESSRNTSSPQSQKYSSRCTAGAQKATRRQKKHTATATSSAHPVFFCLIVFRPTKTAVHTRPNETRLRNGRNWKKQKKKKKSQTLTHAQNSGVRWSLQSTVVTTFFFFFEMTALRCCSFQKTTVDGD